MRIRRITQTVVAGVCAVALSISTAGIANASPNDGKLTDSKVTVEEIRDSHATAEQGKIREALTDSRAIGNNLVFSSDAVKVSVPDNPSNDLSISFSEENEIGLKLPETDGLKMLS